MTPDEERRWIINPQNPNCVGPYRGMCCGKFYTEGNCLHGLGKKAVIDYTTITRELAVEA